MWWGYHSWFILVEVDVFRFAVFPSMLEVLGLAVDQGEANELRQHLQELWLYGLEAFQFEVGQRWEMLAKDVNLNFLETCSRMQLYVFANRQFLQGLGEGETSEILIVDLVVSTHENL